MAYLDILLDSDGELQDDGSGDFLTGDASNQLMGYIIQSHPGHWKEFPLVGVGVDKYLLSNVDQYEIAQAIKAQLRSDAFRTAVVDASGWPDEIKVDNKRVTFE